VKKNSEAYKNIYNLHITLNAFLCNIYIDYTNNSLNCNTEILIPTNTENLSEERIKYNNKLFFYFKNFK